METLSVKVNDTNKRIFSKHGRLLRIAVDPVEISEEGDLCIIKGSRLAIARIMVAYPANIVPAKVISENVLVLKIHKSLI